MIKENLPGSSDYDASLSLMTKLRKDSMTASEITHYVDDLRMIAATKKFSLTKRKSSGKRTVLARIAKRYQKAENGQHASGSLDKFNNYHRW